MTLQGSPDQAPIPKEREPELIETVEDVIKSLGPGSKTGSRRQTTLRLRYGLNDGITRTLEEVGRDFYRISGSAVRGEESKSFRLMRHPSRNKNLNRLLTLPNNSFGHKLGYIFKDEVPDYIGFEDIDVNDLTPPTAAKLQEIKGRYGRNLHTISDILDLDTNKLSINTQAEILDVLKKQIQRMEEEQAAKGANP